jgi:hypothetical protein
VIARVVTMRFQPDAIDELTHICRDSYVPVFEQMRGFRGGQWLADPFTGEVMQVTLWDSEVSIQGMVDSAARQALERRVTPLAAPDPQVTIRNFVVMAHAPTVATAG